MLARAVQDSGGMRGVLALASAVRLERKMRHYTEMCMWAWGCADGSGTKAGCLGISAERMARGGEVGGQAATRRRYNNAGFACLCAVCRGGGVRVDA